jgi:hypothetical protein
MERLRVREAVRPDRDDQRRKTISAIGVNCCRSSPRSNRPSRFSRCPSTGADAHHGHYPDEDAATGSLCHGAKPYPLNGYQTAKLGVERLGDNSLSAMAARIAQGVTIGE